MKLRDAIRMSLLPAMLCASASALAQGGSPTTPIQHVIVIFNENESFDHYFGTYPNATNADTTAYAQNVGAFWPTPYPGTPTVNGLTPLLLTQNPSLNKAGTAHINPGRLGPVNAFTCSMNHSYGPEQEATDSGFMDKFVQFTSASSQGCMSDGSTVLGYYDGNTVTALWNYAQNFAMNDNSYDSVFGPSTPGAINLISGQTLGGLTHFGSGSTNSYPNTTNATVADIGDFDPYLDDCGLDAGGTVQGTTTLQMTGKNIGDLLNAQGVSWGWFQGGFAPTTAATFNTDGSLKTPAVCNAQRVKHAYPSGPSAGVFYQPSQVQAATPPSGVVVVPNPASPYVGGSDIHTFGADYVAHHEPFQFYTSTANPHHLAPASLATVGKPADTVANHQYDASLFFQVLNNQGGSSLPAVSFIKAPYAYNAHPSNSDPLTEQYWTTQVVNAVMNSPYWSNTLIVIAYDDSDGWYDHQMAPIVTQSNVNGATVTSNNPGGATTYDNIGGPGVCGTPAAGATAGRCGHGPRLPLILISPYSNPNYVDHSLTDQASIIAFIEQNWNTGYIDGPTAPSPIQNASFDRLAGTLTNMLNFSSANPTPLFLSCQGAVVNTYAQSCQVDPNP